ncbi:MAG: hypothetical protein HQ565_00905 [Bacteroidetes bacterium]|nr:hypothetical protein [Bacteroidota bacterium]
MKKLALSLFAFTIAIFVVAQEKPKIKEVGVVFSNLDNFGLSFKIGNEKALWRINTLLINGGNSEENMDSVVSKTSSIGFGFGVGREYRKTIAKNFELRYGADLSFRYINQKSELNDNEYNRSSTRTYYVPRFNLVFGFNYVIKEQFIIGAEILPYFSYTFGSRVDEFSDDDNRETDISRIDFGLSNTSIMLSVGYRF